MQERVTNSNQDEALLLEERQGAVAILTLNGRGSQHLRCAVAGLGDTIGRLSVDADVQPL